VVRKRRTKPNNQELLFPLPEKPSEPEIRFEQSEHPVWTENKAKLIEQYLYLFVLVTKHGTYIDGFAGPQRPENPEMWAAKLVLECKPQRLRNIFLFDKSRGKIRLLCGLRRTQASVSGRVIRIFHGDFNTRVRQLLQKNRVSHTEATFCLLDQTTFQCHWSTLLELAKYKGQGKPKIELFYFLAVRWLRRALTGVQNEKLLEQWWGREDWPRLKNLRPNQIQGELVERFKTELGYKYVLAWPIYKQCGSKLIVYFMIHATDHAEAPKLMARAYNDAVQPRGEQLCLPGMPNPGSPSS
jgi:three-Cys-motif partner protein